MFTNTKLYSRNGPPALTRNPLLSGVTGDLPQGVAGDHAKTRLSRRAVSKRGTIRALDRHGLFSGVRHPPSAREKFENTNAPPNASVPAFVASRAPKGRRAGRRVRRDRDAAAHADPGEETLR